jgi:hypothetical protein
MGNRADTARLGKKNTNVQAATANHPLGHLVFPKVSKERCFCHMIRKMGKVGGMR